MEPPLISVLLPTRRRRHLVQRSVDGLLGLARDARRIQVAAIYDDDDEESHGYFTNGEFQDLCRGHGARSFAMSVPRMGYSRLNEYLNILAPKTQGSWLLFWNDDAVMETPSWDQHVYDHRDFLGLLHIHCRNVPMKCSIWPLFSRRWLDIFGMVSPNTFSDSWISDVCIQARARRVIPVTAFHDRYEETGNNQDSTWQERSYANRREYHSQENQQQRNAWAQRLITERSRCV